MCLIVTIIVLLVVIAALPSWPHSNTWGYGPSGALTAVLVILIVLMILGWVPFWFPGPAAPPAVVAPPP